MAGKRQVVVFKVGEEEFALDIMLTKEIVVMRDIAPIPETEEYVEGVMNLRGSLVPVLDFRKLVRAASAESHAEVRIIVANLDGNLAGLVVDSVCEVLRVAEDQVEPAPEIIAEMGAGYVAGVIVLKGRFITLLDLGKALSEEIMSSLGQVTMALAKRVGTPAPAQAV